ncbi:MAG: pre-peptidase C-terminal domain-containing protein [Nannocystaceae bacterium]
MKANSFAWLTALTILAGCAETESGPEPGDGETADFRDGSYHYVFGYDPATGEQIRGGGHMVVTFDDEGKTEAIDSANRTSQFHPAFTPDSEYAQFDASLTEGETDWEVFASTWWPMSKNGTAWRWQPGANQDYEDLSDVDTLSPMEKYDLLFYPGQSESVAAVSSCSYADYVEDAEGCEKTEHPALTVAGPATKWELENQGVYQWVQPESWWGHCNGWASYVTSEPMGYPQRDVSVKMVEGKITECVEGQTEGCILWKMADIEGLFTELHFSDKATFTGRRCRTAADEIERDEYGRPTDVSCRDLNPGSFHIAITGMLGRGTKNLATNEDGKPAFVIDHTADYEVWNFPINAFNAQYEDITEEQANELVGATGSDYVFNDDAVAFQRVLLNYSMISDGVPEAELLVRADERNVAPHWVELNYIIEIDAAGRIIGGEWIKDPVTSGGPNNQELHPDFAWMAVDAVGWGEGSDDTGGDSDNPYIALSKARALLQCANEPTSCAPEDRSGQLEPLLDVTDVVTDDERKMFVTEQLPAGELTVTLAHTEDNPGGDADLYVRVGEDPTMADYDCRPWEGGSDEVCVIELTAPSTIHVMVHGYPGEGDSHFRLTVDGDVGGAEPEAWGGLAESGRVARDEEVRFSTPSLPVGSYLFELDGTNDADLYVRAGEAPTEAQYDCRPYLNGSQERCTVTLSAPAEVHVMVRGYADSSDWELTGARVE